MKTLREKMLRLVLFIKEAKSRDIHFKISFFKKNTVTCIHFHHKSIYTIQFIVIICPNGTDLGSK